ncbi:flavin reductase family protein [Sporomusa acidovorans]|uniref:Flavoredoxin n=1 Tax=Sporomusa acidovorans (strain ATCC 49682 / DSM 3132 / Mol) TaxID=1123286 RepID=A0ABZ3IZ24_SPOA4|nr:flavin reductase family protein [Sporomusa acidovorans]OZC14192.1 flavoredoxin [Sporomusa acidovorans DSM 3132]SDE70843.1 NADH-FMN oxidoreductase RutF, flavin reductase (DIM6/NTAB) family [Sporomusa acidovorans]
MKKSLGTKVVAMPSPVWVVGSYDDSGKPNMMTVAWGGIVCSTPPCIAISLRKSRLTYTNILMQKAFTINIPSVRHVAEADYIGLASGKDTDKFAATGLTPLKSDKVNAPYIKEFPLTFECKLLHTIELGAHTQFIGQIIGVKADEEILDHNGMPIVSLVKPLISCASDRAYYAFGEYLGQVYSMGVTLRDSLMRI